MFAWRVLSLRSLASPDTSPSSASPQLSADDKENSVTMLRFAPTWRRRQSEFGVPRRREFLQRR
jgi:hypothetical protein